MKNTSYFFWLMAAICLLPQVSAGVGLLLGVTFALSLGNPNPLKSKAFAQKFLALAVMGLGASMDLGAVVKVGTKGIGYTFVGIAGTLALGYWLSRILKVSRDLGLLISVGTAICGGSAIAALASVLRPRDEETSMSLATVFLLNASALFLFPWLGRYFGLSSEQFGLWSALAIHDTSSVVGAAISYGAEAVKVATTVKLARALWILPLALFFGFFLQKGTDTKVRKPWFILGFIVIAALVTWLPQLQEVGLWVAYGAKRLMVVTLFLIGSGLSRSSVAAVGWRPFAMGVTLWFIVAACSLWGVESGWVHL